MEPSIRIPKPSVHRCEPSAPRLQPSVPLPEPSVQPPEPSVRRSVPTVPRSESSGQRSEPSVPGGEPSVPPSERAVRRSEPFVPRYGPSPPEPEPSGAQSEPSLPCPQGHVEVTLDGEESGLLLPSSTSGGIEERYQMAKEYWTRYGIWLEIVSTIACQLPSLGRITDKPMISPIKPDDLLTNPIDTRYPTPYHLSVDTLASERNNWRSGTTEVGGGGTRTRNPGQEAACKAAAYTSFATPPKKDGGREARTLRLWFLRPVAGDLLPPSVVLRAGVSCKAPALPFLHDRLSAFKNLNASPLDAGRGEVPHA
jgi:hypothetical protein